MRRDLSILWASISHSIFVLANTGLITHHSIYTCLGAILIRYAQYILALRVRYVRYTLACNARSLSSFEFARHFESHLARPPPFYMRLQTRRLPMNIPLLQCYAAHVLYSQPIRLRTEHILKSTYLTLYIQHRLILVHAGMRCLRHILQLTWLLLALGGKEQGSCGHKLGGEETGRKKRRG